jgi:hypothetical protein
MYIVRKFISQTIKDHLLKTPKFDIFSFAESKEHMKEQSCVYSEYDENKHQVFNPLVAHHEKILNKYGLKLKKPFIENREYILDSGGHYIGKLHRDSLNDDLINCYTSVWYYRIDSTLRGGELLFPPFGKFTPKVNKIITFDGDILHKVDKIIGHGTRGIFVVTSSK